MSKIVLKLILVGQGGVGKTSLVKRYIDDSFTRTYQMTLGQELYSKEIKFDKNTRVVLNIHDLAGQERFSKFRQIYLRQADLGFLVFDITSPITMKELETSWLPEIEETIISQFTKKSQFFPVILIGNKIDLKSSHNRVSRKDVDELRASLKTKHPNINILNYIETSALENINVELAFTELVKVYLNI
ncbi:MAG: GTP-binding protein [Candidatus Hodarchaeales archaeon]|jgi:small GTP-binding protein